ncbi:MAG: F0F1 ATP synthase subunit A [Spirochaetes bacterium]|nr:F0F1 ATP synthase subunit A [Spirochaetota bacterium]MBU1079631.1 F0F1 ATP synthase subunit A [Spirochaetota bacterium]
MERQASEEAVSIGQRITEAISIRTVFTIRLFGNEIPISDTVIGSWVAMAIIVAAAIAVTRRLRDVPRRPQAIAEAFVEFADSFACGVMGPAGKAYAPFLGTLAAYLAVANLLPMLTPIGGFGFEPPFEIKPIMRDINITAGLSASVIAVVLGSSIAKRGVLGWAASLLKPVAFMLPFNILEYAIRPVSLALRLFGNILGAFIIMRLIEALVPIGAPPIAGLYFDLFDGVMQTVVFVYLSTIFIGEAIHMEEAHE